MLKLCQQNNRMCLQWIFAKDKRSISLTQLPFLKMKSEENYYKCTSKNYHLAEHQSQNIKAYLKQQLYFVRLKAHWFLHIYWSYLFCICQVEWCIYETGSRFQEWVQILEKKDISHWHELDQSKQKQKELL